MRAVPAALGRQLTGDERVELAARLPHEAAVTLTMARTVRSVMQPDVRVPGDGHGERGVEVTGSDPSPMRVRSAS